MDLLAGLNGAQRQAVVHSGSPLVVLAGPGTGKTRVIAHRVAHLIVERRVPPQSVVALTFTVKACEQMRRRIAELLIQARSAGSAMPAGPQRDGERAANAVNIHTYHGLGHRLVRRFADRLGYGARPVLIDSAQHARLVRQVIRDQAYGGEYARMGIAQGAARVIKIGAELGDYALSPAQATAWAAGWEKRLTENPQGRSGQELAGLRARQRLLLWAAGVLEETQRRQRERGWLTMNDLLTEPLRLLRTDPLARDVVRGELRHAVVDEFQDVNQATVLLLEALFPPEQSPDLCVVGDDDQAIYAFRGADDRAFAKFALRWPTHSRVKLNENYRSAPPIVELANGVMSRADERFDPDKKVVPASADKAGRPGAGTMLVRLENNGDWLNPVVSLVLDERRRFPDRPWSTMAIIARGHGTLAKLATALEAQGVPTVRRREGSILDEPGVADLLAWCRLLVNPLDVDAGRRILLRPPIAFAGPRVLTLLESFAAARSMAEHEGTQVPGSFLAWALMQSPGEPALARAATVFDEFHLRWPGLPAGELVFELALSTDVIHTDLLSANDRAVRLQRVVGLLRAVQERQDRLDQPGDLRALLAYLDDLDSSEREGIDDAARIDGDEEDHEGGQEGESSGATGVHLLTAHASKGLEYDTVIVARANPKVWSPASMREPGELPAELLEDQGTSGDHAARARAEDRRLFYVACTRAERRLIIVADLPKGKPTGLHLPAELVNPSLPDAARPGEVVDGKDVVASLGLGELSPLRAELQAGKTIRDRQRVVSELAAKVRISAAAALERAADPNGTDQALRSAQAELASAARRMSVISTAARTGAAPTWAEPDDDALVRAINDAEPPPADGEGIAIETVRGPLRLSYSQLDAYRKCPACWYLKYRLRLTPPASKQINTGTLAHEVLCTFYSRWAEADASGEQTPGVETLEVMGRAALVSQAKAQGRAVDADDLASLTAMLRTAHLQMHGRDGHSVQILEKPELAVWFPFGPHRVDAKIDRLERTAAGGVRIVDYKTGRDWKDLREPKDDDLQMGIYTLALDHHFGEQITGVAEYWLLAAGTIGAISLSDLSRTKVTRAIERIVTGMLAGDYQPAADCKNGVCRLLRGGLVIDP